MRVLKPFLLLQAALATLAVPAMAANHGMHCDAREISAASIRTREDIKAFVECAHAYVEANGTAEAYRAFHEDARWKSGQFYVFVDQHAARGEDATSYVYPPDPSREGVVWGPLVDRYGTDYFVELNRIMEMLDPTMTNRMRGRGCTTRGPTRRRVGSHRKPRSSWRSCGTAIARSLARASTYGTSRPRATQKRSTP